MSHLDGIRLDVWLVANSYASGREKAKQLIRDGWVSVDGTVAVKASLIIRDGQAVVCSAPEPRYVGRGGYKLEKALQLVGGMPPAAVAMDIGASTGGFTDCMLQNGASRVYAVDVGHGQLHSRLRADPRVICLEGTDVRSPAMESVVPPGAVDFCSVDVSFISLRQVLPAVRPFMKADGIVVCLIKPQFEVGRAGIGKNGIVKDPKTHRRLLKAFQLWFAQHDFGVKQITFSPITGGEGNIEYLAILGSDAAETAVSDTDSVVVQAFRSLKEDK